MLFNSFQFWLFFAAVFVLCRVLPHRWQNLLLLAASYIFYAAWDWRFLSLIWISTLVDYIAGRKIAASSEDGVRRLYLVLSIVTNLGLLATFKYFNFFAGEFCDLLEAIGFRAYRPAWQVVLPVGISFYTFQTMSYTIDVYRRRCQPARNLGDFALFVCFFPQLVAGPIERFNHLMPQIENPRTIDRAAFATGLYHVLIGLFKKVVVADNMALLVDSIFATPSGELTGPESLVGLYAFAMQIYGDFSGYSSIAQGVGKWLGFDLSYNFKMPYFAATPGEFWRRWHITLSQWLRDYLYIPLGGNRRGTGKTYRNLLITMTLGGLWHGAGWTFIAWGVFHGALLCLYRPWEKLQTAGWRRFLLVLVFFHLVLFGWLLFRAGDIRQAWSMLERIVTDATWTAFAASGAMWILFFAGPMLAYEWWVERSGDMLSLLQVHWLARAAVYTYWVLMLWFFAPPLKHVFIYFQF